MSRPTTTDRAHNAPVSDLSLRSSAKAPSSLVACSALARLRALLSPDGARSFAPAPAWLLASCTAALAVAAHGSAGGTLSDSSLTALLTTLLAWGGTSLARRGGLLTLIAVLATTQATQHVLLTEVAHVHQPAADMNGWLMLGTHAVATVLSALLLARAGAAIAEVAAAVRWLVGRLQALCAGPTVGPLTALRAPVTAWPGVFLVVLLRRVSPRRGPPVHS